MKKISIVDYGCGNLLSISRALKKLIMNVKSQIKNTRF